MEKNALIFKFLKDLAAHNDRAWFQEHRAEYDAAFGVFEDFLGLTLARISSFDETMKHVGVKECTYRIYRDTRFSPDKTPYKTHFGGYMNARGKKANHCGYYLHFEPGRCMIGGGSLDLPSPVLKAVRRSIYDHIDEFLSFAEDPAFKQYFPVIGEDFVKTAPKGFPKDFAHIDYLRCRQYVCIHQVPDDFLLRAGALERVEDVFRQFKRFADFINETIDDFE